MHCATSVSRQDGWLDEALHTRSTGPSESAEQQSEADHFADAAQRLLLLGEMTAGITHDFRNILAIIESGLSLAEKNFNDPKMAHTFIAGAREGVARGSILTSQLLNFVKPREARPGGADVNELLKALESLLRYGAGPEVRVAVELSPDVPRCPIDPTQFNAAILNLVINARDAMLNGGEVRISTALRVVERGAIDAGPVNFVRVRVSDDGSGIPTEVLEKVFQPFFTTKGERGTGLGLPQVGTFVRDVGGHVRVSSDPGHGTTVDLFLPSVQSHVCPVIVVQS